MTKQNRQENNYEPKTDNILQNRVDFYSKLFFVIIGFLPAWVIYNDAFENGFNNDLFQLIFLLNIIFFGLSIIGFYFYSKLYSIDRINIIIIPMVLGFLLGNFISLLFVRFVNTSNLIKFIGIVLIVGILVLLSQVKRNLERKIMN